MRVTASQFENDCVVVSLDLAISDFDLTHRVSFGKELRISLAITNCASTAQTCEVALHSYFQLSDACKAEVTGLETLGYLDQLTKLNQAATGKPISFSDETDRIYFGTAKSLAIHDPVNTL